MIAFAHGLIDRAAGAELRRLRLAAGLSQSAVARRMATHKPLIGRAEHGVHCPSLALCASQAEACGGSIYDVLHAVDVALGLAGAGVPVRRRVSARA